MCIRDRTNYARWLPVHIRDMILLENTHPDVFAKFRSGFFTVSKSHRRFSSVSIDQAHEQLNAVIKTDGGVVGLTENDAALSRWTIAGPEITRVIQEFEASVERCTEPDDVRHHEQQPSFQKHFRADVLNFLQVLTEEHPFSEWTAVDELVVLGTHVVAEKPVVETVKTACQLGYAQLHTFVAQRLLVSTSLLAPLTRNKLPLFTFKLSTRKHEKDRQKLTDLKSDCELFSRLYIASQSSRSTDLDQFFCHENQPYPPSLSNHGYIRFGTKSDLLDCFKSLYSESVDIASLNVDTYVLDGAVIVQMLQPGCSKTFDDYKSKIFTPYLLSVLDRVTQLHVVFDVYSDASLKASCREKRGTGTRVHVTPTAKLPSNWQSFLRVDENKHELFNFLADCTSLHVLDKLVVMTKDERVICNSNIDRSLIDPCKQEEADTRILLHCLHAAQCGRSRKIAIRTVDTDIVVIATSVFAQLNIVELWVHFGTGRNVRLIPVHELYHGLGPTKASVLPIFHALTGCDTVSCFYGKGKKSAWEAWNVYPEVTSAFLKLLTMTSEETVDEVTFATLQRYVVILYDRTSDCTDLDSARRRMFTHKYRTPDLLPPTSDAFMQHVKRAVHQSVHCWGQSLAKQPTAHDASSCGWVKEGDKWVPVWTMIPRLSQVCEELVKCACKKGCRGNCKCLKAGLECTQLCLCVC